MYVQGLEIIFQEPLHKISDGIVPTVGYDRSPYLLVFFHKKDFSCGLIRSGHDCIVFIFFLINYM